jgi:predicted restriction endonuclease
MSTLSPIEKSQLNKFISDIDAMRRGGSTKQPRPHKLILLMAIIKLIEKKQIIENKVPFDDTLKEAFSDVFEKFHTTQDWNQPSQPYFHLRTSDFWFHKIKAGRESAYAKLTTSGGGDQRILQNIEYAYFSDEAFNVLTNEHMRSVLHEYLLDILTTYKAEQGD